MLERTETYRDRIRGEVLMPWGVSAAQDLGIYDLLTSTCAVSLEHWSRYFPGGKLLQQRELVSSNPYALPLLCFQHEVMQQTLADEVDNSQAKFIRGATVEYVEGQTVTYRHQGGTKNVTARLIVGADGRQSKIAAEAGLVRQSNPLGMSMAGLLMAGLLMEGLDVAEGASHFIVDSQHGRLVSIFPMAENTYRVYFAFNDAEVDALSGNKQISSFLNHCVQTGLSGQWIESAEAIMPLGTFSATSSWVEQTPRAGLTLIGDAAGISDPIWGCGLALALWDVRALSQALTSTEAEYWDAAAEAYYAQHLIHYSSIQNLESWMTELFLSLTPKAIQARAHAMPILAKQRNRSPDIVGLGPDNASDPVARARFYCEDVSTGNS